MNFIDTLADMRDELSGEEDGSSRARRSSPRKLGLTVGRVVAPADPLPLGRVLVSVPSIDGLDTVALARVIVPGGSFFSGMYWIPNPGDEVMMLFEEGDPDAAYVLGGVWNALQLPPMATPLPQVRTIRSPLGSQIVFSELPIPAITLQAGPTAPMVIPTPPTPVGIPATVILNGVGMQVMVPSVQIQCGTTGMMMTPAGVVITSPSISLVSGPSLLSITPAGINMAAPQVSINAAGAMALNAAGAIAVTAGLAATFTAGLGLTVTAGAVATVTGGASVLLASAGAVMQSSPATLMVPTPLKP